MRHTYKLHQLHLKCGRILEMIEKAEERMKMSRNNIDIFKIYLFCSIESFEEKLENDKKIVKRLIQYYNNTASQIGLYIHKNETV